MIKKFFANPVRATFVLTFAITSACGYFYEISNGLSRGISVWKTFEWSLTYSYKAQATIFLPLLVAAITALLVKAWSKSKVALENHTFIRYSSRVGFVLLYPVLALFGSMGILYIS